MSTKKKKNHPLSNVESGGVVVSGVNASKFASMLSVGLVSSGISRSLRKGRIWCVVEVLKKVDKLKVPPLKLFDGSTMELLLLWSCLKESVKGLWIVVD
ncbi:hypothetical protein ACOSQ4_009737 [Xanthoceras sorbifolium]